MSPRYNDDGTWSVEDIPGWETHEVRFRCHVIDGLPRVTELHLLPKKVGAAAAVTSNRLRHLPVLELARIVLAPDLTELLHGLAAVERAMRGPHRAATIEDVAQAWNVARQAGAAPRAAVCKALNVAPRTADRYIREARELGLIPATSRARKNTGTPIAKRSPSEITRRAR